MEEDVCVCGHEYRKHIWNGWDCPCCDQMFCELCDCWDYRKEV
jgi:hypothetical protein